MKKILCCLLMLCIVLLLCSYAQPELSETEKRDTVTAISDDLIRCLSEKDHDGFAALFCGPVRSHPDFEDQIDVVFDFFEEDNYTRSQYVQFDWETQGFHRRQQESFSASVVYIQDPTPLADGTPWHWFFELRFDCVLTCLDDDTLAGIHTLTVIRSNDGQEFQIGTDEFWPQ